MFKLVDDPIGWSRAVIGTWPRFMFMAVFFVAWPFAIAYVAIEGGWRPAIGTALFLGFFQLVFLYALRRSTAITTAQNNAA